MGELDVSVGIGLVEAASWPCLAVGRLVMIILILMILIMIAIIILAGLGGGQAGQGQVVAELEYCVSVRPTKGPPAPASPSSVVGPWPRQCRPPLSWSPHCQG